MDGSTLGAALSLMIGMPDNAASSAAEAAASAASAKTDAESIETATVEEIKAYLHIE